MRGALALVVLAALGGGARAQVLSPGPLSSAHSDIDSDDDCDKCHSGGRQVVADRCLACHDDLGRRIRAGAGLHGRNYRGQGCADCHVEHYGRNARLVRWPGGGRDALDHDLTGWVLDGGHRGVDCGKCHTQTTRGGRTSYLGTSARCASCHRDVHGKRFGAECASCHDTGDWKRARLDRFDHKLARYRLEGAHATVACAKCHGQPPRYTGLRFGACTDCHQDPHGGRFKPACESCHTVAGWKGDQARDALRADHPGLSLRGGHRAVACERCHDRGNDKKPARGSTCFDCHRVVHRAPFGRRCESCHGGIQWLGLPRALGLAAHEHTAYKLDGKHVDAACAGCHPPGKPADQRFRKLVFDRCAACHADRHGGEFAARAGGECGGCHRTAGYAPARFGAAEHATTAFALDGRHLATPCAACHTATRP
ncbi:MAG TPA: hypothetical protein VL172_02990, partial [Kofleriaceae bacterium]|nr:hypothetical protein [Kofleriaceae bacterium]